MEENYELFSLIKLLNNHLLYLSELKLLFFLAVILLILLKINIYKKLPNWNKIKIDFELLINKYKYYWKSSS